MRILPSEALTIIIDTVRLLTAGVALASTLLLVLCYPVYTILIGVILGIGQNISLTSTSSFLSKIRNLDWYITVAYSYSFCLCR